MSGQGRRERFPIVALHDHLRPQGVNDAWWATTESYCKTNTTDTSPYLIPNEWIAGRLAQYLCLPIAPFAILKPYRQSSLFASLGMTARRIEPPRHNTDECLKNFPDICAGVLIFDIVIANCDRHSGNIRVDKQVDPTWMRIIDHDRSLFGYMKGDGVKRLNDVWSRLGISGGQVSDGNRHVFLDAIKSSEAITMWCDRVYGIPGWYIEDACNYVVGMGIGKRECKAAIEFLKHRCRNISDIIDSHRDEFSAVDNWGLLPP